MNKKIEMKTGTEYVIRASSAKMPSSCWGTYRHVAVMEVEKGTFPTMISERARGVVRIIEEWRGLNVGPIAQRGDTGGKCAYSVALRSARALIKQLESGDLAQLGQ